MKQLHVCMITGDYPPDAGGISQYVYNLSKMLVFLGHEVTVLTRGSLKEKKTIEDGIVVYRLPFFPIYPVHVKLHGYFVNKRFKNLEADIDIIHCHSPLVPVLKTNKPMIVTSHVLTEKVIGSLRELNYNTIINKLFRKILVNHDLNVLRAADKIIVLNEDAKRDILETCGLNNETVVIPNGVDTNLFKPIPIRSKNEKYVLFTSKHTEEKGIYELVNASKLVINKHKDIKFVITGKGPLTKRLYKQIKVMDLERDFILTGHIDRGRLLKLYQNAFVFVLPSYYEGLSTSLLEAMSCGIPVVATAIAGTSEVVVDSEAGLLVPPKNPEKLADAIIYLLGNEDIREKMGKNGRKKVEDYSLEKIAEKIEKIYEEVIHSR